MMKINLLSFAQPQHHHHHQYTAKKVKNCLLKSSIHCRLQLPRVLFSFILSIESIKKVSAKKCATYRCYYC